jgi:hypothetical protein
MLGVVWVLVLVALVLVSLVPTERRGVRFLGIGIALATIGLAFGKSARDGEWWTPLPGCWR